MSELEKMGVNDLTSPVNKLWEYSLPNDGLYKSSNPFVSGVPEHLRVQINKTESSERINYEVIVEGNPKEGDSFSFTPDVPGGEKSVTDWSFESGKWVSHTWKETEEEEQKPE